MTRRIPALLLMAAALLAPRVAAAGERVPDLLQEGYRVVYTDPYLAIEGCQYNKRVVIGRYAFTCQINRYVWHYGKAALLVLAAPPSWPFQSSAYICVDEDRCLPGELLPPQ